MGKVARIRGDAHLFAIVAVLLVAAIITVGVYVAVQGFHSRSASEGSARAIRTSRTMASVEAVRLLPGVLEVYVRGLGPRIVIDRVYIKASDGSLIAAIPLNPPVVVERGQVKRILVPLVTPEWNVSLEGEVRIELASMSGVVVAEASAVRLWKSRLRLENVEKYLWVGLVAGRDVSCSQTNLDVDVNRIHWVYINLLSGAYHMRYVDYSTVRDARGHARVFTDTNVLDLHAMSWEERYRLGPVVVFINPYKAARDYRVTVIPAAWGTEPVTIDMPPLVNDPHRVLIDALILWEDLWWPGTTAALDDYLDHVIRFTLFVNGTARIEVVKAKGCYLHMFIYGPHMPPFDSIPSIVREYMENGHRLPASAGVVYVKSHGPGGRTTPPRIWDPVRGVWVSSWPPLFRVRLW